MKTAKPDALSICRSNTAAAQAKKAEVRAKFPTCAGFIDELAKAGLNPRVISMRENGNEWVRGVKVAA